MQISASQLSPSTAQALLAQVDGRKSTPQGNAHREPAQVTNPEYVIVRPVYPAPAQGSTTAAILGEHVYFEASQRILDLRQLVPQSATVQQGPNGTFAVLVETTSEGSRSLAQWTKQHLNQQIGVFVDNQLVSAPVVKSTIDSAIVIENDFTRSQAEAIAKRIRGGGTA